MQKEVLIPFKQADFIRDVITTLKTYLNDGVYYDDDKSEDWIKGFKVGINNAIVILEREINDEKV